MVKFDATPEGLWNIMEFLLLGLFLIFGTYFFRKYLQGRKTDMKSLSLIQLGYSFFFWGTGINQLLYLLLHFPELWPTVANFVKTGRINLYVFSENLIVDLNTQVVLLTLFIFLSVLPFMYATDKYIKNRENVPIYKLTLTGIIIFILPMLIWFFIINRFNAPEGHDISFEGCFRCWLNYFLIIWTLIIVFIFLVIIWNFVIFYIILAIRSPKGEMKMKASLISLGILLLYFGLFGGNLSYNQFSNDNPLILLGPVAFLLGLFVLFAGFKRNV